MTAEVRHVFRPMAHPARLGELRSKTWEIPVYLGPGDETSPHWHAKIAAYWERQMQLYGIVMSDFTIAIEPPDPATGKPPFLSTYATVLAILPGERHASMVGVN